MTAFFVEFIMPNYVLPSFNLMFDFWMGSARPPDPPTGTDQPGQLYVDSRQQGLQSVALSLAYVPSIYIRMPSLFTNVWSFPLTDSVFKWQDQFGNDWYYKCNWWDFVHAGFPNEYVEFRVQQCASDGSVPDPSR